MTAQKSYLTAREAAAELGVSRATLYSYVSRGLIRSEATANARARLYAADDVARLRQRKTADAPKHLNETQNLNWGQPVLDTRITLIADGRLYYRGRDAIALSAHSEFETVARLLWRRDGNHGNEDPFAGPDEAMAGMVAAIFPAAEKLSSFKGGIPSEDGLRRSRIILSLAADWDTQSFVLLPQRVAETGARILRLMTWAFAGPAAVSGDDDGEGSWRTVSDAFGIAWNLAPADRQCLQQALILLADHELNPSTFTVRVVASTAAPPYAAILAGLSALEGPKHGGYARRVAAMMREFSAYDSIESAVTARLRRDDPIHGFSHPLYPDGDPRAAVLMTRLADLARGREDKLRRLAHYQQTADYLGTVAGRKPNIDFALMALADMLELPPDAPFAIFAVARSVGWIAHIQEQYAENRIIRPRARYQGEQPDLANTHKH